MQSLFFQRIHRNTCQKTNPKSQIMMTMMKYMLVALFMMLHTGTAFSIAGAFRRVPFVTRTTKPSSLVSNAVLVVPPVLSGTSEAQQQPARSSPTSAQSLDEFNAFCRQVIAEERNQHYYVYLREASSRRAL
jgi:hypothetical protein